MRNTKKWMTAVLTAAMVVSQVVPAFASSAGIVGTGTTSGTANILAYSVDSIVVPTTMKVALNPYGYLLNVGYKKAAATFSATKTYYTKAFDSESQEWKYTKVATPVEADIAKYYEVDTVDGGDTGTEHQVVSLNYGIANKSTKDKVVQIDIRVTQNTSEVDGKRDIVFVDTADKATFGATGGPGQNDMKMYLEVIASKNEPTTDTFVSESTYAANTAFYTKGTDGYALATGTGATAGVFDTADNFKAALAAAGKLYKETQTIGPEITGKQLSDVAFTVTDADETGAVAFVEGKDVSAKATIGFKLKRAVYNVDSDDGISAFDTTQAALSNSMNLVTLGSTAGFTIQGKMNNMADWTKAKADALYIQPTYKVSDATGDEKYIDTTNQDTPDSTNPYHQVSIVTRYVSATTISTTNNSLDAVVPDGVSLSKVEVYNGEWGEVPSANYSLSDGKFTVAKESCTYFAANSYTKMRVTFSDDHEDELTIE